MHIEVQPDIYTFLSHRHSLTNVRHVLITPFNVSINFLSICDEMQVNITQNINGPLGAFDKRINNTSFGNFIIYQRF